MPLRVIYTILDGTEGDVLARKTMTTTLASIGKKNALLNQGPQ